MGLKEENWNEKWAVEQKRYEKIWFSSYSFRRIREEVIKRIKGEGLDICEFGSGGGLWLKWFKDFYSARVHGIDNSEIGLELARKNIEGGELIVGDVRKVPFSKERFDLVYCLGLIEHFNDEDIQKIVNEMYEVTKRGRWTIVTTPNRSKQSFLKYYEMVSGACQSERSVEISQMRHFLERAGFKKIEIIPAGLFIPKLRNKKWFSKLNLKFFENFAVSDNIMAFARK